MVLHHSCIITIITVGETSATDDDVTVVMQSASIKTSYYDYVLVKRLNEHVASSVVIEALAEVSEADIAQLEHVEVISLKEKEDV